MALQHVPRCQHVKVNGVQCGSPALRSKEHCFFHTRAEYERRRAIESKDGKRTFGFPLLEDANSIQVALMKVIQMLGEGTLEEKKAGVMIYALQTASNNLRHLKLEPEKLTDVVIDEDTVDLTRISGPQWASGDFPASPPAEVLTEEDEMLEDTVRAPMQDEPQQEQRGEEDFQDRDLVVEAKPEVRPAVTGPTPGAANVARPNVARAAKLDKPASPAVQPLKPTGQIVDPVLADAVRRREQKRKLVRKVEGEEQDSLAAVLLKRMGLIDEEWNMREEAEVTEA